MKKQIEEVRRQHEQMVKAIESRAKENNDGKENAEKMVNELKEQHVCLIQEREIEHEKER